MTNDMIDNGFTIVLKKPLREYSIEEFMKEFFCGCALVDLYETLKERPEEFDKSSGEYKYTTGYDPYGYLNNMLWNELDNRNKRVRRETQ